MTPSLQPTTSASQRFPSYGPQWQGYDLHQGGYGRSQMIPPPQCPGERLSPPGEPNVPPGLPGNHPLNRLTSSSCTSPAGGPSSAAGRPPLASERKDSSCHISINPGFRLKHPGVPDSSDGSDGTSYPLTENYTLPVAQATGHVPLQSTWERQRQTCERLGAPRITVEHSGKNNISVGNAAGAPGTHSYY